jgi:uncharacterized protein (TIGR00725 family)
MADTKYVGVIGAGQCSGQMYELARDVGRRIGRMGWFLVCGGLKGVMEGAARGCVEVGGTTVGLLPGLERNAANPFIKIALPTGLGEGRNALIVRASEVLIAIAGGYGTLSEIALALKTGKTVIGLETWKVGEHIRHVATPEEAIERAREILDPPASKTSNGRTPYDG